MLQPSADEVALRAGLSRRSIFNHFTDLAELYDAVLEAGIARCAPLLEEGSAEGPVAARVERLIDARARFLEATRPFAQAVTAQSLVGPEREQAIRVARHAQRLQHADLERLLGADLADLPEAERVETFECLSAALSPAIWDHLRHRRGQSIARARATIARSVRALLRDAGVSV